MPHPVTYRKPGDGATLRLGPGEYLTDLATGEDTQGGYTLYEVVSALDSGVPLHEHDWAESFYIMEGRYEISYVDDADEVQVVDATPGTFVHVPGNRLHAFKNVNDTFSKMLSINQPLGLEPLLRQVGLPCAGPGAEPEREPVPMDEFRAAFTAAGLRVARDRLGPDGGPGAWRDRPAGA
jgi:quercetin dioxygenase-like cupin family protein